MRHEVPMNMIKLRMKCVEQVMTQRDLADAIGISLSSLQRKLRDNGDSFTLGEILKIKEALKLSDQEAKELFFDD